MTTEIPAPLISADRDDHAGLAEALATRIGRLPHRPRVLGLGEPMHGVDDFPRLRNALFEALAKHAGFTTVALESSAWHGRAVEDHVQGGTGDEDAVMAGGFTHGWGEFPANRELVRRLRAAGEGLRFAGFDAPVEMHAAPSPRPMLQRLHGFLDGRAEVPAWSAIDELVGPDGPWEDPAAAMEPARSVGAEARVHELRAVTDDLRRTLEIGLPALRREVGRDELEDVLLAGRTAAGLLAYHAAMAHDTDQRWSRLSALRDAMMAENLRALAERGPVLAFGQNEHLRTGTARLAFGPQTLSWQPVGAHLAGPDYRVIACAFGAAESHGVPAPEEDTLEGLLYRALPPGNHLLPAAELQAVRERCATRVSPSYAYLPLDETVLGQVDELLFLRDVG